MCSQPRQSRLVSAIIGGLTKHTANRCQKPSLRRANEASLSSTRTPARAWVRTNRPPAVRHRAGVPGTTGRSRP
ncbi:hypothetical protein GCM10009679_36560 [Saccharothrix algeriensis]|uniref:Uncharacterized protein n=1 Tax=Catellatospora bangladeshensis TaxID=310355 RepID=A0A8J3JFV4_9ACTN|nr:hypothetical protein Cba03nite_51450 [Catellatospora bangladeshensis]